MKHNARHKTVAEPTTGSVHELVSRVRGELVRHSCDFLGARDLDTKEPRIDVRTPDGDYRSLVVTPRLADNNKALRYVIA